MQWRFGQHVCAHVFDLPPGLIPLEHNFQPQALKHVGNLLPLSANPNVGVGTSKDMQKTLVDQVHAHASNMICARQFLEPNYAAQE